MEEFYIYLLSFFVFLLQNQTVFYLDYEVS